MNNEQIKEIALANGFKLKEQPNGEVDLNPYVYKFSRELLKVQHRVKERANEILRLRTNVSNAIDCLNEVTK